MVSNDDREVAVPRAVTFAPGGTEAIGSFEIGSRNPAPSRRRGMTLTMSPVTCYLDSPLGRLRAVATDAALIGLYFPGHLREPDPATTDEPAPSIIDPAEHRVLGAARRQLDEYLSGRRRAFDLPLDPQGNAFQRRVWGALQTIPFGSTLSYGDLAAALGEPGAAQAVGSANARNPISIVIPCHRVIGVDGWLTGYAGGLQRKRFLLDLEGAGADRLF